MSKSNVALLQGAIMGRRVRSRRELSVQALQCRLIAVQEAREHNPAALYRLDSADWDAGIVRDLQRAALKVSGAGLALEGWERRLIARRPWYGRDLDDIQAGWDGFGPETHATYNDLALGRLNGSRLGRCEAIVDLLISVAGRLLDAVAPPIDERTKPRRRTRRASTQAAPHAGQ